MYYNLNYKIILFAIVTSFAFLSCKKEQINTQTNETPNQPLKSLSVENGMLCFSDYPSLNEALDGIINQSDEFLNTWEANIGFISMRRHYENLSFNDEDTIINPVDTNSIPVEDGFFATILNPDGYVKVGETIWQVTKDNVIENNTETGIVTTHPIERQVTITMNKTSATLWQTCCNVGTDKFDYNNYQTDYRAVGNTWNIHWGKLYSSCGAKTEHEKYKKYYAVWCFCNKYKWDSEKTNRVEVKVNFNWNMEELVNCSLNGPFNNYQKTESNNNNNNAKIVVAWRVGSTWPWCVKSGSTSTHTTDKSGNVQVRTLTF